MASRDRRIWHRWPFQETICSIKIKSKIHYAIIHNNNIDTQIQVRGRYTGDLETVYLPSEEISEIIINEEFLGKKLFSYEKAELCEKINLRNANNRLYGWTTIKRLLLENGNYLITEGRENNLRYALITLAE